MPEEGVDHNSFATAKGRDPASAACAASGLQLLFLNLPEEGVEPSRLAAHDLKSCVSAISPLRRILFSLCGQRESNSRRVLGKDPFYH